MSAAPAVRARPVSGAALSASPALSAAPATMPSVVVRRLTGQKILGDPGSAEFVLQLSTKDGEFLYEMSRADLKDLASMASQYSQGK